MFGVVVNSLAIVLGGAVGLIAKKYVSKQLANRLETVLGFAVLIVALKMAWAFQNVFVLLFSLCIGTVIGTYLKIDERTEKLAERIGSSSRLKHAKGFGTALSSSSIVFCVGAMSIIGAIQSGSINNHEVLFTKAVIDGVIAISFASLYGIGVVFSSIPVLLYEGSIASLAGYLSFLTEPAISAEVTGVGGVLMMMISVNLIWKMKIPVADFIPAIPLVLILTPLFSMFS